MVNRTIRVPRENQNKINVIYNINLLQEKKSQIKIVQLKESHHYH